jgi:hypothetical protein
MWCMQSYGVLCFIMESGAMSNVLCCAVTN